MIRHFAIALLLATPAAAQTLEVSPIIGLTTSKGFDQRAAGVEVLRVGSSVSWGGAATYFISPRLGIEGLFMQQPTDMTMTAGGVTAEVFEMNVMQFLGSVVYEPGPDDASVRPFIFGGLGATVFSADDFDSETKLAWTIGGGFKWFLSSRIGVRAHLRYKPTVLGDSSASICGPFGFCQSMLHQMELAAGAVIRF